MGRCEGVSKEVAESRIEAFFIVPGNHVPCARHVGNLNPGQQLLKLFLVLSVNHAAATGHHQQHRYFDVRYICMNVVLVEAVKCRDDRSFVASLKPFGTQPKLRFCPGGAKLAHLLDRDAALCEANRIDVPGQLRGLAPAAWTRDRWVDEDKFFQPSRMLAGQPDADARTH